ncbi:hypothetical protein C5S31_08605 [ANME-1 cluster archaeon GoMg2]|nr:hypothetical protein [ANME-1 cluster archaeon GoMg2]
MKKIIILLCIGIGVVAVLAGLLIWYSPEGIEEGIHIPSGIEQFGSEEEFMAYLSEAAELERGDYIADDFRPVIEVPMPMPEMAVEDAIQVSPPMPAPMPKAPPQVGGTGIPTRISETTVQVLGIDEPDVVKTDGEHIYFSSDRGWKGETRVISAFPPSNLSVLAKLKESGDMLLVNETLVIFDGNKIYGYNVSQPESPEEAWQIKLNGSLVSARLCNGSIYLVTKNWIDRYDPLPIYTLSAKGKPLVVRGSEIYHPPELVPVDVVYTAAIFDPEEGEIKNNISFVGSSGRSVIYMSEDALYITYTYRPDPVETYYKFLKEKCHDLVPAETMDEIDRLMEYDISNRAKMVELEYILERDTESKTDDSFRRRKEFYNRLEDYFDDHKRDLETTGIVKIGLADFDVEEQGEIPGRLLNQFSLDEHNGYLRVATTVEGGRESVSDVYVLAENLDVVGSVKDLGKTERIYAVRFLGDMAYVVTFRDTDPFYVLDLSNQKEPELKGELKIPGYSSYLHPITDDLILGIGKEGWEVKLSLFDVATPSEPEEVDKYILEESWSDVLETHHAFLIDNKHGIFFLPGREGGYIFSYADEKLVLEKAVRAERARRAIYIADYLYVIADTKLVVLDETTWEKVNELEFDMDNELTPYPRPFIEERELSETELNEMRAREIAEFREDIEE